MHVPFRLDMLTSVNVGQKRQSALVSFTCSMEVRNLLPLLLCCVTTTVNMTRNREGFKSSFNLTYTDSYDLVNLFDWLQV